MEYKSLVVGSSSGIGLAITQKLLRSNHQVTGISRRDITLNNKNYTHVNSDVSTNNFMHIINSKIDLVSYTNLIFCVGINKICLAKDYDREDIENLLNTNLIPAIIISNEFAKSRKVSSHSSILFIGSIWSSFGLPGRSVYGATKSALTGFSRHLSAELSPINCFVNVLSPGFTDTKLTERTINDPLIKKSLNRVYHQKLLKTEDIALHAMMLLRPNNKCITGQEIFTDGGFAGHA